jgi:hypothetical protein
MPNYFIIKNKINTIAKAGYKKNPGKFVTGIFIF